MLKCAAYAKSIALFVFQGHGINLVSFPPRKIRTKLGEDNSLCYNGEMEGPNTDGGGDMGT